MEKRWKSTTKFVAPNGAEPWVEQRIRRLAREGKTISQISIITQRGQDQVQHVLNRPPHFQRCPRCRGMVLMPCRYCALQSMLMPGV